MTKPKLSTFPVGSALVKTFAFPADYRKPGENVRLIETRVLLRQESGWQAWAYLWNAEQTDAALKIAGAKVDIAMVDGGRLAAGFHLFGPQQEPVQGLPRLQRRDRAARAQGAQPERRLRICRWHEEPAGTVDRAGYAERSAGGRCCSERSGLARRFGAARRSRPRLARRQLRALPSPRRPGQQFGLFLTFGETDPVAYGALKAPRGGRARLGRPGIRHQAGRSRRLDPGVPRGKHRSRRDDARAWPPYRRSESGRAATPMDRRASLGSIDMQVMPPANGGFVNTPRVTRCGEIGTSETVC